MAKDTIRKMVSNTEEGKSMQMENTNPEKADKSADLRIKQGDHKMLCSVKTSDANTKFEKRAPSEFGGTYGVIGLMIFSHFIVPFFNLCLNHNAGNVILPESLSPTAFMNWGTHLYDLMATHGVPTAYSISIYWGFMLWQVALACVMPGVTILGLPIITQKNKQLKYLCNAYSSWLVTLPTVFVLHMTGMFPITDIIDNITPLMSTAVLSADLVSLCIYFGGFIMGTREPTITDSPIYNFVMGETLNPRIGSFDIKMFAEVRISWIMLYLISISCAVKQYNTVGYVTYPMMFLLYALLTYTHAIMKGEDKIVPSYDIQKENFSFFLCFWNLAGVAFLYSSQVNFALVRTQDESLPGWFYAILAIIYTGAYYVFDCANCQKNAFRMQTLGIPTERPHAYPQFEYGILKNPKYILTEAKSPLLVDGFYQYARKLHYTADIVQSLSWGICCGFTHFIPFFYPIFFFGMITHRVARDEERMKEKYTKDWNRYVEIVPYRFIPGVY